MTRNECEWLKKEIDAAIKDILIGFDNRDRVFLWNSLTDLKSYITRIMVYIEEEDIKTCSCYESKSAHIS